MKLVPNFRIVKRDDWIDVTIASFYGGYIIDYRIYPDGTITEHERGESMESTDVYSMLSLIAETTSFNLWALEDGDMTL